MTDAERFAYVRDKCWTYWGRPPSADEQKKYADIILAKGVDLALAAITDHADHAKLRAKRGW